MTIDAVAATSPGPQRASHDTRTVFGGILIGLSLAAVSQTLVTTALPTIVGELGGYDSLSWVVSAYLLTSAVVVPFAGKLADLFGATRLFQLAIVTFACGSLLAGLSGTMVLLVLARGVQGVGGGAIMTLAYTLIARIVPSRERGRYTGYVAAVFAITSVTGPLVGGFLVDHLSWRWAFYLNVALSVVALGVIRRSLPSDSSRTIAPLDYTGAVLLVAALVSTMLVTMWGGQTYAWASPTIIGLGVAALVGLGLFGWRERVAPDPIVPFDLFTQRVVRVSTLLAFLSGVAMFGVIVYAPTFLQVAAGASATRSGLLLIPLMGGTLVGSTIGGRAMSRTARFKAIAVIGSVLFAVGTGLLATLDRSSPEIFSSLFVGLFGIGLGLTMPVTVVAVQNAVVPRQLGAATSATQFSRKIGATLGVAALGGVFNARVLGVLDDAVAQLPEGTTSESLLETPAEIDRLPQAAATAVRDAVADGATLVFTVAFVAAVLALVVALRLPNDHLHEGATDHGDGPLRFRRPMDGDLFEVGELIDDSDDLSMLNSDTAPRSGSGHAPSGASQRGAPS
jgi:EmrB/QacA subfamily drug resistance transporter